MILAELEKLSGVPQQTIGKIERGAIRSSKFEPQLLAALGLRADGSPGEPGCAISPQVPDPTETDHQLDTADGSLAAKELGVLAESKAAHLGAPMALPEGPETEASPSGATLADLRRRAFAAAPEASQGPSIGTRRLYRRSQIVHRYVLARANATCEGCSAPAPFVRSDGSAYLEPHHLRSLSDDGLDHPAYVIAICPNCHKRVHYGADGTAYNAKLIASMAEIEPYRS